MFGVAALCYLCTWIDINRSLLGARLCLFFTRL